MSIPDCIVCGGRRYLGSDLIPFCEVCEPAMSEHVVSMQVDQKTGEALAVCPCGWSSRHPWTPDGRGLCDNAVVEHWQSVRRASA